jgi:DNA-binding MarR family transcriptional regulator
MLDDCLVANALPVSVLLSQPLVAFTIELDNEFEHRMPHRTTRAAGAGTRGPWLVSLAMWSNFLRCVDEDGVPVRELRGRCGLSREAMASLVRRMSKWWGYVTLTSDPGDSHAKPPPGDWLVRPTRAGLRGREIWPGLLDEVEGRWCERFGERRVGALRAALETLGEEIDLDLPRYLPVGGLASVADPERRRPVRVHERLDLPALLSQALLAFAIDYERESKLGLAVSANVLRVLDGSGVRVRDLPRLTGTAKEAVSVSLGLLGRRELVTIETAPHGGRTKIAQLTPSGRKAQKRSRELLEQVEAGWRSRFGAQTVQGLRLALEPLVGDPAREAAPLLAGLEPYPDGWRAAVRRPDTLPHYPFVSHRGGYPDGS